MKRKLLSVVAIAMAMAMTTTAFAAPRERGNGDVDGDGTALTAADLISLINNQGKVANDAANLNGRKDGGVISANDVLIAYKTVLQPNTVKEDLVFNVYTEGLNSDLDLNALHANDLGAGYKANAQGTSIVDRSVTVTPTTTIKDAIDQFIDLATSDSKTLEKINSQLNNIQFHSNVKGEVTLRSNNGWSMLAYALQPIVPMDDADAALCNKTASSADEIAAKKDRYDALKEAKAILVGTQTDDAAQNTTALSASEVIALKNAFYKAIPTTGLTDAEVKAAAERVLAITDTKYSVTANDEVLSSGAVEASSTDGFIKNILAIKEYGKATMADYRNAFGDKLVLSNGNINVVFEVAVVAGIGNDEESTTEATTAEATTEATTAEATTEATTAESTTEATTAEATTEATTAAPVDGFVGTANISAAETMNKFPTGLTDKDEIAKGVSIINGGSAFQKKTIEYSFNNGAYTASVEYQVGKGNGTISDTLKVGDKLDESAIIEKAIKFTVGGSGTVTVYGGVGSGDVTEAPVYLIDLNTREIVAVSKLTKVDVGVFTVETMNIPKAGEYAYVQPNKGTSVNVAGIALSITK